MKHLALSIPDYNITPNNIPTGGANTLSTILNIGFELAVIVAIIVCLFILILGGFNWLMSGGDKQKVAQARQRLVFAIIGITVVFISMFLLNVIYYFFFGTNFSFIIGY